MIQEQFVFTPDNLLENISKLGAWSSYGLASCALAHYFPDLYDIETGKCPEIKEEVELMYSIGCSNWHEIVIKFHKEVGYDYEGGSFNPDAVNEN